MGHTIIGLGNPGPEYERTRHNAGFIFLDHLVARWGLSPFRHQRAMAITSANLGGTSVRLIKPLTWMNRSGEVIRELRSPGFDYRHDLLVVVDDTAFEPGTFRLRSQGGAGGHNGLRSIEAALGSKDYARIRIGIGARPRQYDDLADWVLGRFTPAERKAVDAVLDPMAEATECWVHHGIEIAMSRYNHAEH